MASTSPFGDPAQTDLSSVYAAYNPQAAGETQAGQALSDEAALLQAKVRELETPAEIEAWKGPVNYITMVEAFKSGPHASTPLRICMNSAMRQPPPVSKSLNDILMKGPSALNDLYHVTLGLREDRYALTKDISKFYNSIDADPVAQNMRRVVWRFGDRTKEPKIFRTTTVNFGDRPAGCISIAAARETADKFGNNGNAAWFPKIGPMSMIMSVVVTLLRDSLSCQKSLGDQRRS